MVEITFLGFGIIIGLSIGLLIGAKQVEKSMEIGGKITEELLYEFMSIHGVNGLAKVLERLHEEHNKGD